MLDKNEERMKIEDWWRFRSEITSDTCPTRKQTDRNGLFITGSHYTEKYSGRGRGNHDKQMSIVESSRSLLIVYVYRQKQIKYRNIVRDMKRKRIDMGTKSNQFVCYCNFKL